jgi:hypothetical protein
MDPSGRSEVTSGATARACIRRTQLEPDLNFGMRPIIRCAILGLAPIAGHGSTTGDHRRRDIVLEVRP